MQIGKRLATIDLSDLRLEAFEVAINPTFEKDGAVGHDFGAHA